MLCSNANKCKRKCKLRIVNQDQRLASDLVRLLPKAEKLNETAFSSLAEARILLAQWRRDYNANRPHSRLGWLTPSEFADRFVQSKQRLLGAASQGSAPIAVASTAETGNHEVETLQKIGSLFGSQTKGFLQFCKVRVIGEKGGVL